MKINDLMGLLALGLASSEQSGFNPISHPNDKVVINLPPKPRPDSRKTFTIEGVEILALTKTEAVRKYKKGIRK